MAPSRLVVRTGVQSSCTGVCQLDKHDVCTGCFRTLGEIARWSQMAESEQVFVLKTAGRRKKLAPGIEINCHATENVVKPTA